MKRQRKLIHIQGETNWCLNCTHELLADLPSHVGNIVCYGLEKGLSGNLKTKYIEKSKKRSEIENHLGSENSVLIYNCFDGFNPDIFCALAGLIKSPGLIIFLTPTVCDWPNYPDPDYSRFCSYPYRPTDIKGRFICYLIEQLSKTETNHVCNLQQNIDSKKEINSIKTIIYKLFQELTISHNNQPSSVQKLIIDSVGNLVRLQTHGVIVIHGNRGRGKTTSIGLALSQLFQQGVNNVTISVISQNKANVSAIFDCLNRNQTQQNFNVEFFPPDEYLNSKPDSNLVVIDEAAAIPIAVLKKLVVSSDKLIIATTVDGYEGSGMGFLTKFQDHLIKHNFSVKTIELQTPFRWEANDPIEQFIFATFFPQKFLASNKLIQIPEISKLSVKKLNRDDLIINTLKTQQLFSLLAQAHYRTTPDDLRYLLDAPDVEIWVAEHHDTIHAALLVVDEGPLDNEFTDAIWLGKRRLNGHLIPQTLSAQNGFKQAIKFTYKRIIRIATLEPSRNRGIASKLLSQFQAESIKLSKLDFIGVSYGYEIWLSKFWQKHDFMTVRFGHRENARSGLRSVLMLRPLSDAALEFCGKLQNRYRYNLQFEMNHLDKDLLSFVHLNENHRYLTDNREQNRFDVYSFAYGHRQYLNCQGALNVVAIHCLNVDRIRQQLSQHQLKAVTLKVLLGKSWKETVRTAGFNGKTELLRELRTVYAIFYTAVWGNKS